MNGEEYYSIGYAYDEAIIKLKYMKVPTHMSYFTIFYLITEDVLM